MTKEQENIYSGKLCPYCKKETEYKDSSIIYGKSYGMVYICSTCDAYVGVHKGTDKALGRLADKKLRELKKETHKYFDLIWKDKSNSTSRKEAYEHLSKYLKIPLAYTHIGMFKPETCVDVIDWSKMILNDLRRLNLDCGLPCEREHIER